MALAHTLGFPHIGRDRELKKALEAYGKDELDEAGLREIGRQLRAEHWRLQQEAGIELLPVGDFAWYDQVLNHSLMFGVVPERFRNKAGRVTLDTLHAMAHDSIGSQAPGVARWFGTDHYHLVPEFTADQRFRLSWEQLFEETAEALALGHRVKPVLIGPLTYLWLGKVKGTAAETEGFDKLELLERLLPVYGEVLGRLAALGVEWVQIDEPILGLDLPQQWKTAFERAYNLLQAPLPNKLLTTYFAGLENNLGLAANLPVAGLHIDVVSAPQQLPAIIDRLPAYKVLSLGVVDGCNGGRCDLPQALELLRHVHERFGERLWVAPSSPLGQGGEDQLDVEFEGRLAGAVQKCQEVGLLARALSESRASLLQAA